MKWFNARARYWLIFLALFSLSFLALQKLAGYSFMRINVSNSYSTYLTVYWTTDADPSWSQSKTATLYVDARKENFILPMPVALSRIKQLRIDPSFIKNVITDIREISFHSLNSRSISFSKPADFARFEANEDVGKLSRAQGLRAMSTGPNAEYVMDFPATHSQPQPGLMLAQAGLLALLLGAFISRAAWLFEDLRWVPAGLLMVAVAALVMATLTRENTHPDEFTHIVDAKYYKNNDMPPEVCSAQTRNTYTVYGVSRLDKREIAYYVGGHYLELVDFIPGADYIKLRYLNVAMLFVLALLAFQQLRARYLFLPLLLTPQAWYLFSYYNSDALSLFAVALTAYQVFVPQSMLRRLLDGERPPGTLMWVLALALLVAMQYWLKLNYMFYPILLLMLGASWWLLNRRLPDLHHSLPLLLAFVMGTTLFATWEVTRHAVNDFSLSEKVTACAEITAAKRFKPSTPLAETDKTFRLRAKGVGLQEMLVNTQWARRTFFTGLGAYGYTEYLNADRHYVLASRLIVLFFLYVVLLSLIRGNAMGRMTVLSVLASIFAITAAAIINNWDQSFQTQGRYLMVYLPLLGTLIVTQSHKLSTFWLSLLALGPFALGLYSFFAVALVEIPN